MAAQNVILFVEACCVFLLISELGKDETRAVFSSASWVVAEALVWRLNSWGRRIYCLRRAGTEAAPSEAFGIRAAFSGCFSVLWELCSWEAFSVTPFQKVEVAFFFSSLPTAWFCFRKYWVKDKSVLIICFCFWLKIEPRASYWVFKPGLPLPLSWTPSDSILHLNELGEI